MIEWFNQLNSLQQIFCLIAIPSTLVLILQTILLLFGIGDGETDVDGDGIGDGFGDDGLALFSVKGIMAFLCIGGWSGMALTGSDMNSVLAIFLATLCGLAALVGVAYVFKLMMSLQSSGNIDLANAIGKVGQVYIPIPGNAKGNGKITVIIQGTYSEVRAITNEAETLKTGEAVRVVSTDETGLLVVERVKK
ncbi:MAG: hypothetical protein CVU97_02910 [Firmicutes bacterium HGW-Firmicutes-21]|nr:MAG: hypothetical protein CVU97_02910 [Firmicutes bacterium HGW-Firmicutes-21]